MSNTYTQIHIQCIAAVKFRQAIIHDSWKERLHEYITGIVRNFDHKMLSINTMPDHIHFLVGFRPHQSLSDLMKFVKGESSEWINKQKFTPQKFRWQDGFGEGVNEFPGPLGKTKSRLRSQHGTGASQRRSEKFLIGTVQKSSGVTPILKEVDTALEKKQRTPLEQSLNKLMVARSTYCTFLTSQQSAFAPGKPTEDLAIWTEYRNLIKGAGGD